MNVIATLRTHTDKMSTDMLIEALQHLDSAPMGPDEKCVRAAMLETLEARYPAVEPYMVAWSEDMSTIDNYTEALVKAIEAVTR